MYVILDLEWASNQRGQTYPTQIAAARVDSDWNIIDIYSALIAPRYSLFYDFSQVGYWGHEKGEFADADCAKEVFFKLLRWLRDDDILCWWQKEAGFYFEECCHTNLDRGCSQKVVLLREYVLAFLNREPSFPKNPYKIAQRLDIVVPKIMHESWNDVQAIAFLLAGIAFDQRLLAHPPAAGCEHSTVSDSTSAYLVDRRWGIVHRRGCEFLSADGDVAAYSQLKTCVRHQFMPCKCCASDYKAVFRQCNEESIQKSEYNYIFTRDSKIFHKYTCGCMKNAKTILGTIYYASAERTGCEPCKRCHPSLDDTPRHEIHTEKQQASVQQNDIRMLGKKEKQAVERYERAKKERALVSHKLITMTEEERSDHLTLTQSANVFWAASGYRSFHTRNCKKMKDLKGFKGFSHYADAVRAGYAPCRCCRPTAKMDSVVSIPMFSKERENESPAVLEEACRKHGYVFSFTASEFTLETPVGIWCIHTDSKPYGLHHINLAMTPNNREDFHKQPKIFLSLLDAFFYIQRHDCHLIEKEDANRCVSMTGWKRALQCR